MPQPRTADRHRRSRSGVTYQLLYDRKAVVLKANEDIIRQLVEGVPDLVIEVLSPATARHDRTTKYQLYAAAGVTEYWIIDPDAGAADIHTRRGNGFVPLGHYERGGVTQSELLPGLRLSIDDILADV